MNLNPSDKEKLYLSKLAEETARLRGVSCTLIELDKVDDIYDEGSTINSTKTDIWALIEENPNKKVLKDLNWFNEDSDTVPIIVDVPMTLNEITLIVKKGHLIEFRGGLLKVTDVRTRYVLGMWYTLKCVHYEINRDKESGTDGNTFIKGDIW